MALRPLAQSTLTQLLVNKGLAPLAPAPQPALPAEAMPQGGLGAMLASAAQQPPAAPPPQAAPAGVVPPPAGPPASIEQILANAQGGARFGGVPQGPPKPIGTGAVDKGTNALARAAANKELAKSSMVGAAAIQNSMQNLKAAQAAIAAPSQADQMRAMIAAGQMGNMAPGSPLSQLIAQGQQAPTVRPPPVIPGFTGA